MDFKKGDYVAINWNSFTEMERANVNHWFDIMDPPMARHLRKYGWAIVDKYDSDQGTYRLVDGKTTNHVNFYPKNLMPYLGNQQKVDI